MAVKIFSGNSLPTREPWQKKIVRTSDGTIHVILHDGDVVDETYHLHSHDGVNWTQETIWQGSTNKCSIDKDSNDNLVVVGDVDYNGIIFKKATVNKSVSPWTWTWGAEKTIWASGFYPDICVDGNGYFHVTCGNSSSTLWWFRCIDGVGDSWTKTNISGWGGYYRNGIMKDSGNNLFIIGGYTYISSYVVKGVKITYSIGPSWAVGTVYTISPTTRTMPTMHILSNNKIVIVSRDATNFNIIFRKTHNASDLSVWDDEVIVDTDTYADWYSHAIMALTSSTIRVYYTIYNYTDNLLYYKESTNGGLTFGSRIQVNGPEPQNESCPNVSKKSGLNQKIDFVWNHYGSNDIYYDYASTSSGSGYLINDDDGSELIFERIIDISLDQACSVALRDVPLKTGGEIMDTGTYLIGVLHLKFVTRLSASEKTTLETMYDSKTVKTICIGDWTFTGWFKDKSVIYEAEQNRPWKAELTFDIYTYTYAGAAVGTFSNTQLRLVGAATLDYEDISDVEVSEETSVAIPNWVNQDPEIDVDVWNKKLKRMIYTVRDTEYRLYTLLQMLTGHTAITLYDYVHGPTNKTSWLTSVKAKWEPKARSSSIDVPWEVEFEVIVQN